MNLRTVTLVVSASILLTALVCTVGASHGTTPGTSAGMLPYSPTRLEWLELQLQANYRDENYSDSTHYYSRNYVAKSPDTIIVVVQYAEETPAQMVEKAVDNGKHFAEKEIASYGWSSWAKVEVKRELTK